MSVNMLARRSRRSRRTDPPIGGSGSTGRRPWDATFRRWNRLAACVVVAASLWAAKVAIGYDLYRNGQPAEGLFPFTIAAASAALGVLWFVFPGHPPEELDETDEPDGTERDGGYPRTLWVVAYCVACTFAAAAVFERIGFEITITAYSFLLLMSMSRRRWWLSLAGAVLATYVTSQLFALLGVYLPSGLR